MTTLNISLNHICSGGGHMRLAVSVDGDAVRMVDLQTDDIQAISADDIETTLASILKLYAKGKTKLQIKNGLQTGLEITL